MRSHRTRIVPIVLSCVVCLACSAIYGGDGDGDERDFAGTVTHVFDGDSFIVESQNHRAEIEVRLDDIDAPEKDQPHADVARAALEQLIEARRVFVDVVATDRYDRKVAKVYREPDRLDVARTLVRDGHAWVNRRYAKETALVALEERARARKVGLWALPEADRIAPWRFRQTRRAN